MPYQPTPLRKTIFLLLMLYGFSVYAGGAEQHAEMEHPERKPFKDTDEMTTKPEFTTRERQEGFLATSWGSAYFRLSPQRGFELTFDEYPFTLKVGGRLYLDIVHYFNDKNHLGDNGIGMRTLQVDMTGKLSQNWGYRFSLAGFTSGGRVDAAGVALDDAFFRYLGFDRTVVTIGQQTEPFSLEQMTSSLNMTFMERALPNAFAPGSTLGVSVATGGEKWFVMGGFFSRQLSKQKTRAPWGAALPATCRRRRCSTKQASFMQALPFPIGMLASKRKYFSAHAQNPASPISVMSIPASYREPNRYCAGASTSWLLPDHGRCRLNTSIPR